MKLARAASPRTARAAAFLAACASVLAAPPGRLAAQSQSGFTYNGMDLISYSQGEYLSSNEAAQTIRATGANYTAVMATWYVQTYTSTSITSSSSSPSDAAIATAIQSLQSQGITVTLKPHVDSMDGNWRGDFTWPSTDTTVAEQQAWLTDWFTSYESFIMHFAQIASDNNVGTLVIGTEFAKLTGNTCAGSCENYWLQYVINPIRAAYPDLTLAYGANATSAGDEFTAVSFWDDVDIIGVDGYFPLTGQQDPSIQQLVNAWTIAADNVNSFDPFAALKNLHSAHPAKPLIFTEIGYESTPGTNEQPYNYNVNNGVDDSEQANCYAAFFQVFSGQPWMSGVFWWDWSVSSPVAGTDTGYSPQNKYAGTTVLPQWYGSTSASFTLAPANSSLTLVQGLSTSTTINVTPLGGFTGSVTLAATGLPAGVTASFAANPTAGTTIMTLTASGSATTGGPVTVTISGASNTLSASTTIQLTVAVPPSFSLSASPGAVSIAQGGGATTTITVVDIGGFNGAVTFTATGFPSGVKGSFAAGTAAGSEVLTITASSKATVTTSPVPVTITGTSGAIYEETSIALTVTGPPAFTGSSSTSTLTVQPGATTGNTATISITGTNGFTGTVTLACTISPPATNDPATCSLSPTSVTIGGAGAVTSTLTLSTTAPTSASNQIEKLLWRSAGETALAFLFLFAVPRRRNWLAAIGLLALFASIGVIGCGGHGKSTGGNPGTTPGTYTVLVTGISGSLSAILGTVNLTVQ
jgi:Glycoside Hydrolase Family 113